MVASNAIHVMQTTLSPADLDHVLAHTRALWPCARRKRIFLTGGTGFFGAWLVDTFADANARLALGAELVVLTRDPNAAVDRLPQLATHDGVVLHQGDVRGFERPQGGFDLVIHAAAESSQQAHVGDHRHMFDTVVDGTRETLALAREAGADSYLIVSSGAVYGRQPPTLSHVPEDYSGGPDISDARSAYGEAKRAAEVLSAVEAEPGRLSVRVARCFAFVGPHLPLDAHFAIGNFIGDALRGGPLRIHGDGTAVRSYLYMADLAVWLWTIALNPKARGAYNVGSENAMSILETARAVARVCAPNAAIDVLGAPSPRDSVHRYVPSTRRAQHELSLRQTIDVDEAIRRTAEWYQQAPVEERA